jgi:hypothetical protein
MNGRTGSLIGRVEIKAWSHPSKTFKLLLGYGESELTWQSQKIIFKFHSLLNVFAGLIIAARIA